MDLVKLLHAILRPALGCTEPVAVALAVAAATRATAGFAPGAAAAPWPPLAGDDVDTIRVAVSKNVFKNAFAVYVPVPGGHKGIVIAAALGAFCDPSRELRLLDGLDAEAVAAAECLVRNGRVAVEVAEGPPSEFHIDATVLLRSGRDRGRCVIHGAHERIVRLERDGVATFTRETGAGVPDAGRAEISALAKLSLAEVVALVAHPPPGALELIRRTVAVNVAAAEAGLAHPMGLGTGFFGDPAPWSGGSLLEHITSLTAAGSDARMSGFPVEVMSSAGSGNQGIVATVPVVAFSRHRGVPEERMLEAVALAHLVTMYITHSVGYLSALCGVAIKAGIGAACGVVHAMGGGPDDVARVVKIMAASLTGMICDGAKAGCALKVSSAADMAVRAASLAMKRAEVPDDNGIVAATPEETIANLARLSRSMESVDREILAIMKEKIASPGCRDARMAPAAPAHGR